MGLSDLYKVNFSRAPGSRLSVCRALFAVGFLSYRTLHRSIRSLHQPQSVPTELSGPFDPYPSHNASVRVTSLPNNEAFTELTGYAEQEAVGKKPSELKSGKQKQAFYDQMWALIKGKNLRRGSVMNEAGEVKQCAAISVITGGVEVRVEELYDKPYKCYRHQRELSMFIRNTE